MLRTTIARGARSKNFGTYTALLLSVSVLFFGCTNEKGIVVIDHWWNADYARNACWLMSNSDNPCVGDPAEEVRDFESRLASAFAADSSCGGVSIVSFENPTQSTAASRKALGGPHWMLMMSFKPGESAQSWKVDGPDHRIREGKGDPNQMAHAVCAVVKHTGASVQD